MQNDKDNKRMDPKVLTFASRLRFGPFIIAATLTLPCSSTSPWVVGFETRGGSACEGMEAGGNRDDCGELDVSCRERLNGSIREECPRLTARAEGSCNYWIAQVIRMNSISKARWGSREKGRLRERKRLRERRQRQRLKANGRPFEC